jgi:ADP-ribosylglycohydrolase
MDKDLKILLKNTLLAQALGDAFGYIIEFDKWESIKAMYGSNGLPYELSKLELVATDDTQMALFCLEGITNADKKAKENGRKLEDPTDEIYQSFLDWYATQDIYHLADLNLESKTGLLAYKELYERRAPGNTCLSALGSKRKGSVRNPINDSKGCGGIMRVTPIAFFAKSIDDAFDWGVKQAAITHGHPEGYLSAGVYSAVAYELIHNTNDIFKAIDKAEAILKDYPKSENMMNIVNKTVWTSKHSQGLQNNALTSELGQGWVGEEAFSVAVYCAATSSTFKEMIEKSANHSGDSDSTAMLAAGLWYLSTRDESFLNDAKYVDLTNCILKYLDVKLEDSHIAE